MLVFSRKNNSLTAALALSVISLLFIFSCKKYVDIPGKSDPRLSRKYCNDPAAVNYNRDFPGTADNSVCFYPSDAYAGTYNFTDSIFDGAHTLLMQVPLVLKMVRVTQNNFSITGFCPSGTGLKFTSNRSLFASSDTTVSNGQILCRSTDTLSGTLTQSLTDSTRIQFALVVVTDTGTSYHQGTAYRQ